MLRSARRLISPGYLFPPNRFFATEPVERSRVDYSRSAFIERSRNVGSRKPLALHGWGLSHFYRGACSMWSVLTTATNDWFRHRSPVSAPP